MISRGNIELDRPSNMAEREIDNVTISEDCSEKVCCTAVSNIQEGHKDCSRSSIKEPTVGSQTSFKDGNVSGEAKGRKHSRGDDGDDVNRSINRAVLKRHKRDGSSYKEMDACGAPSDKTGSHHQNSSSKDSDVHSEKDGWDMIIELTDPDSLKKDNVINASAKKVTSEWNANKERDGWDRPTEKKTGSGNRDSNFQKEIDGWGKAVEVTVSDPLKKHITESNGKKESSGCGKAYGKSFPDSWHRHGRDWSASKEAGGEGLTMGHTSRDSWKCNSRDGNPKGDTERLSKHDHSSRSHTWKQHVGEDNIRTTDVKGTNWLVLPAKQTSRDPQKHHRGDGNSKWETDGGSKEPDHIRPTAWKIQNQVSSVSRGTEEWGSSADKIAHTARNLHINHGNVNRETEGCGQVLDHNTPGTLADQSSLPSMNTMADRSGNSPDACEIQNRDGNAISEINGCGLRSKKDGCDAGKYQDKDSVDKVTNGSNLTIKQAAPDTGGSRGKDGNVNQVTDGSGTDLHRLNPGSIDDYVKRENDGWGTALNQPCSGTTEHCSKDGFVKRETGGWGIACDTSGPDALKREHRDGNDKGGTGGWGKTVKSGPDAWECSGRAGNVKKENTEWGAALKNTSAWDRGSRGVNIQKEGDISDKGGTGGWGVIVKAGPDVWECSSSAGNVKKENVWGESLKNTSAWDRGSRGVNIQKENDGWGNSKDGDLKKESTGWGSSRDGNLKKEDAGWGGNKDGNLKKEDDGWGIKYGNLKKVNNAWGSRSGDVKEEDDGWGAAPVNNISDAWNRGGRDVNIRRERDGWGRALETSSSDVWNCAGRDLKARRETDGWGKALSKEGRDPCEIDRWGAAPDREGHDSWKQHNPSTSPELGRNKAHRSRSPPGFDRWSRRGKMVPGASGGVCWNFAAGRCRRGSQCKFLHEDSVPKDFDGSMTEVKGNRFGSKGYSGSGSKKDFTGSWDRKNCLRDKISDGCLDQFDGQEMHEPRRAKGSSALCFNFLKGSCYRGSDCKYLHNEAPDGVVSEIRPYDDRCGNNQTKNSSPTWNGPCWDEQTASIDASNSSQWTCGDGAKVTGTCSMDVGDPTLVQFQQAKSVASTLHGQSEVKDGLMGDLSQTSEACLSKEQFDSLPASGHPIISVELKEKLQNVDEESKVEPFGDTGKEGKKTAVNKKENDAHTVAVGLPSDGENNASKDEKEIKKFKFALADFAKDILKPNWKEGHLSKEAHKIIVKKVVEKVISALPRPNLPRNQEQIGIYLSFSKAKITNLVQAYLERYTKNEPVLEKY